MSRQKGFTLIELLVVIAIIGILAAMLFPVFARARESARKIQCLSNVKNIAMAIQMYLTDYDRFPPQNHDANLFHYLDQGAGRGTAGRCTAGGTGRFNGANPFLRWPVILDEYIKNRDVWQCASIQHVSAATWIVPDYTNPWWYYLKDNEGSWGTVSCKGGPCCRGYPSGWGGTVTDSLLQGLAGVETNAFKINIGLENDCLVDRSTSEISDPSWQIVCADNQQGAELNLMFGMAYGSPGCCWGLSDADSARFMTDASFRKKYAPHLGGLNIGFADGHAKWWDAEAACNDAVYAECCSPLTDYSGCYSEPASKNKFGFMCPYGEVTNTNY